MDRPVDPRSAASQALEATPGNTLKIDNIGSDGVVVANFAAGDTIDLGTSIAAISTIVYQQNSSFRAKDGGRKLLSGGSGGPVADWLAIVW